MLRVCRGVFFERSSRGQKGDPGSCVVSRLALREVRSIFGAVLQVSTACVKVDQRQSVAFAFDCCAEARHVRDVLELRTVLLVGPALCFVCRTRILHETVDMQAAQPVDELRLKLPLVVVLRRTLLTYATTEPHDRQGCENAERRRTDNNGDVCDIHCRLSSGLDVLCQDTLYSTNF